MLVSQARQAGRSLRLPLRPLRRQLLLPPAAEPLMPGRQVLPHAAAVLLGALAAQASLQLWIQSHWLPPPLMDAGSGSRGWRLGPCGIKRDDHAGAAQPPGALVSVRALLGSARG